MRVINLIKKNYISLCFLLLILFLTIYSNSNISAGKKALKVWADNVVPALFPFFVASELLNSTDVIYYFGKILNNVMRPIFNLPGSSSYAFIIGLISGYPVGGKIVCDLYEKGECTKEEAERMLAFTNNSGPLFVIGTVGIGFYGYYTIGIILWITHILSAIFVGIIFRCFSKKRKQDKMNYNQKNKDINITELGDILGNAIIKGIRSVLIVGGFVVLFSVIISIMQRTGLLDLITNILCNTLKMDKGIVEGSIIGILEFTNGLKYISDIKLRYLSLNIIVSSFLIGFGGLSVLLQVTSIVSKYKLSISKYFLGKILQGIISAIIMILILNIPNINLDIQ